MKMNQYRFCNTIIKSCLLTIIIVLAIPISSLASDFKLVWEDNFDTTALNNNKWGAVNKGDGFGNNEKQYYTDRPENLYFQDGKLVIRANKEDYEGPNNSRDYTSAKIQTKDKVNFKYKSIRVKAKLPAGTGTWPAIWMLGSNIDEVSWPDCGEIDIMEHVGYDPGEIHGTIHCNKYNGMEGTQKGGSIHYSDFNTAYHTYRIDWYNNKIEWYVDGDKYFTYKKEEGATWKSWPYDQESFLILNLAIGGDWGGVEGIDDSIFPVEMKVDWVKVYDMPIMDIDEDTVELNMDPGESSETDGKQLNLQNIGSGDLKGVSVQSQMEWLDFTWLDNSGNDQSLKISPNEKADELLPGKYSGQLNIEVENANDMSCRVNLQVGKNIALDKDAYASSEYTNPITKRTDGANKAVDGNKNTKWKSGTEKEEWLRVDLEQIYKISNIRLLWQEKISTINGYSYELQLSKDSTFSNYDVIAENNSSRGGIDEIDIDTTRTGQFLRLYGKNTGEFDRYMLSEIQVYGYKNANTRIKNSISEEDKFSLKNAPNPFNPSTKIHYTLTENNQIELSLFNIQGKLIETLESGYKSAGKHKIKYVADNLASGVYICRLVTPKNHKTTKFVLLK